MISAPQHREDQAEAAAEQRGAADHDREDRVELEPEPGIVGVGPHDVGGRDRCRPARRRGRTRRRPRRSSARVPTPESSLARALPPVASISRPSAEPRTTAPVTSSMTSDNHDRHRARRARQPLPNQTRSGEEKVTIRPSVMSWAMPRPATIRIERRHDRLHAEHGDEEAVPRRRRSRPRRAPPPDRNRPGMAVGEARRDRARDCHDRTDREIDAARSQSPAPCRARAAPPARRG